MNMNIIKLFLFLLFILFLFSNFFNYKFNFNDLSNIYNNYFLNESFLNNNSNFSYHDLNHNLNFNNFFILKKDIIINLLNQNN